MIYRSEHKYARIAPLKARRVAHAVQGLPYNKLVAYLNQMPHKGGKIILAVAKSAAANALNQDKSLDESVLVVKSIIINEGPRMKRMWPRARGRADILLKRMSHIIVEISGEKE